MSLTRQQNDFVANYVKLGDKQLAAKEAGYSTYDLANAVHQLLSSRFVRAAIAKARQTFIDQELIPAANGALMTILQDKEASASARVSAARLAYEAGGLLIKDRESKDEKAPHEMSASQLADEIRKLEQELSAKEPHATLERIEDNSTTIDDILG